MKGLIVVALLFISYSSTSEMVEEETEAELLTREKRADSYWATYKPDQHEGCDAGEYAVELRDKTGKLTGYRCETCDQGNFTQAAGFWKNCIPCELESQTTPPGYNGKCYDRCPPGRGWNSTLRKCLPCEAGFFQPEESFNECQKCPMFQNSTRADAECLLECPRGFEPTADKTSCTQCKVGYYQRVPGRKGDNQNCTICCEPPCDKNWTYVVGANASNECIRLPNPLKTCFPYLVTALEKAAKYIYADDTKEKLRPLLHALCLSDANLTRMATEIQACSVKNVTVAGVKVHAYPKLRINATFVLDMKSEVFDVNGAPECPELTEPAEDQGSSTTASTSTSSGTTSATTSSTSSSSSTTSPTTSSSSTSSTSSTTSTSGTTTTTRTDETSTTSTTTTEFNLL